MKDNMETKKKSYLAIAEELQKQQCAIIQHAHKECINILRKSENLRVEFRDTDLDYDVVIYEDNKHCKLQSAYLFTEGSANIQLSLYCHQDKQTYNTSSLNTNLDPIDLLTVLAANIEGEFLPMNCVDHYMYQVEEYNGEKIVHIDGYVERRDDNTYDLVQACGCFIPIADLMKEEAYTVNVCADNAFADYKQYQGEIDEIEIPNYYNPKKCKALPLVDVNQDTPCGFYVDIV